MVLATLIVLLNHEIPFIAVIHHGLLGCENDFLTPIPRHDIAIPEGTSLTLLLVLSAEAKVNWNG